MMSSFYLLSPLPGSNRLCRPSAGIRLLRDKSSRESTIKTPSTILLFLPQKYEMNSSYPWRPSQSELLVRPPIPNHPLYAAACFDEEGYADGLPRACNCVPR